MALGKLMRRTDLPRPHGQERPTLFTAWAAPSRDHRRRVSSSRGSNVASRSIAPRRHQQEAGARGCFIRQPLAAAIWPRQSDAATAEKD